MARITIIFGIMKTILILTDFSKNAESAAKAGFVLAGKLHADVLLFNTCIDYATMNFHPGAEWMAEDFSARKTGSRLGLDSLMEGLESLTVQLDPKDRMPSIYTQSEDTDLELTVTDLTYQKDIEMVVIGARSHSEDDNLYGEDTNAIIDGANRPVFIIPAGAELKKIRKVLFATDFSPGDIDAIHFLVRLGAQFHYLIEIVHVKPVGGSGQLIGTKERAFKEQLAGIDYLGLSYRVAEGHDIPDTLIRLVTETGSGILAMLHRKNSLFLRMFEPSKTKKMLPHQTFPLLVFPSKMD
jgi:nucleotide-binding universal stress UspA family protein